MHRYRSVKLRFAGALAVSLFVAAVARRPGAAQSANAVPAHDAGSPPALDAGAPAALPRTAGGDPQLVALTTDELAALRPLAARGAAVYVRDAEGGSNARITVLARARAPMATVLRVISTPQDYPGFMPAVASVDIVSRGQNRTAFRFHVAAAIFDVTILSALHIVNDHRVDVAIVQSDVGPGASRWDLSADGDGTLVALSTWGDPSRGTWLLRQVAQRSPSAIAGMNISTDVLLLLSAVRRAEVLAGRALPVRPATRAAPTGPLAPPAPGPWMALARDHVVAAITLDADGAFVQSTVAAWSPVHVPALRTRLEDVEHYGAIWSSVDGVRVVSSQGASRRFFMNIHSALSHTQGEVERVMEPGAGDPVVTWRGLSGDFAGASHRWDLVDNAGGTLVLLTGGSEYARAGWMTRAMVDRDVWLLPGYATSWKMLWMRPLLEAP